jgi:chromosome segregation ATPase
MTMGAQRGDAQEDSEAVQQMEVYSPADSEEGQTLAPPRSWAKLVAGLLIFLALVWLGAAGWFIAQSLAAPSPAEILQWIPVASAPLILIGMLWLIYGRSGRRETERLGRAVGALRAETTALDSILTIVAQRLEENHSRLTGEAEKLMTLGDEASDRLGRVAHYLSKESATLDAKAEALENAANQARVDLGVLLSDLPRAEEQSRAIAEALKQAGLTAHEQAGTLEAQLAALSARGREADEIAGGAAQRLGAHLARIESTTVSASARIDEAATTMTMAVDNSLHRASEAMETTRTALDRQSAAIMAAIEQGRAAFELAGDEAARGLAQRLDTVGHKIHSLAEQLAEQDAASRDLLSSLSTELQGLDDRFVALGEMGNAQNQRLGSSIDEVRGRIETLSSELAGGQDRAGVLIDRAREMADALSGVLEQLNGEVPEALVRVEAQAERTQNATSALTPEVRSIENSAESAAASIAEAEASVARQHQRMESLRQSLAETEEQLRSLGTAVGEADGAAARLVAQTGPELVEALVRVREAANKAAERAREAISAVIPETAAALGEASRQAVTQAISQPIEERMGEMGSLSERALETAREASERLTRQMLAIGQTTSALEQRIERARAEQEDREGDALARRVALLIESLNSTSIDVAKILSNDVTDSAWTAYMKGDRGVFTRRAVKLLDRQEAREIAHHYQEEPEFREQVNRYVHDFEVMLRRIMTERNGSALAVTILSSDMGKLYVALAQAIDRLRK